MLFDRIFDFFSSLRLTVVCLALGLVLVFTGTLAQVDLGLYKAQNEYFRSFFVCWTPHGSSLRIPFLPGGYLVGGVLLINLVSSHFKRFTLERGKAGIWMVHFGLITLLIGQLMTDLLAHESSLHLREGQTKNYSEADREVELAFANTSEPGSDLVVAIPQAVLMRQKEIRHPSLPFTVRVRDFYANSTVQDRPANALEPPAATQGLGVRAVVKEQPRVTDTEHRDIPSVIVELVTPQGSLGSWLASEFIDQPQPVIVGNQTWQVSLRLRRYYKNFSIQLREFRHDLYPGTEIPRNFSSRVLVQQPSSGESREVLIKMNSPLRYAGNTFYQASFDPDDHGSVLQVVHNPSWLTPYFSCVLVGLGLIWHFMTHLLGFTLKRKGA
jgi:hypothetical protein